MAMLGNRKVKYPQAFFAGLLLAAAFLPKLSHASCGFTKTVKQAGGGDFTKISSAINLAQSSSPLTTDWCINIDSAVYSEQVTVQNITFTYSSNTLTLQTDPALVSTRATITPPVSSTAAFQIANASVTLSNIVVVTTNTVIYGINASSSYVTISNMIVQDNGNTIQQAGILLSGWDTVTQSTISASSVGIYIYFNASHNTVQQSSVTSTGSRSLFIRNGASSNTVTQCFISQYSGSGSGVEVSGASYNTITLSTITAPGNVDIALDKDTQSSNYNLIKQNYVFAGIGVSISGASSNNTITQSTMTGSGGASISLGSSSNTFSLNMITGGALYETAFNISGSSFNLITQNMITGLVSTGVFINAGSAFNTISQSTIVSNGFAADNYGSPAIYMIGASYNSLISDYIFSSTGAALFMDAGSSHDSVDLSTVVAGNSGRDALLIETSNFNSVTRSFIWITDPVANSGQGRALEIHNGSNYNTVSQSTMIAVAYNDRALRIGYNAPSSNTVTQCFIGGNGVDFGGNYDTIDLSTITGGGQSCIGFSASYETLRRSLVACAPGSGDPAVNLYGNYNTISQSTITSSYDLNASIQISGASATINNSYIQGSTAVWVSGATGTVITNSILVSTKTTGSALWLANSLGLTLTGDTLTGGPQGAGILMDPSDSGSIVLTSNTITTGRWGVYISTMNCGGACSGANLSISSMIFSGGLTAGATAIHFAGGTFVSTFSGVQFTDSNIAVNVNGAPLSYGAGGSRITMSGYSGAKAGPSFEDDPNSVIDWATGGNVPPTNPIISQGFITSVTVNYGTVGASAYEVDASTAVDFSGTLFPAVDLTGSLTNLSPTGLSPNATYYLRAGAVWSGTTFYANTTPSFTVTLASTPFPLSFSAIGASQFTVNWPGYTNPATTVYTVDISTDISYSLIAASASTTGLTASFLGLQSQTAYYVRVRAFNSAGAPSPYALGAVFTAAGVITLSANFSTQTWYNSNGAFFNAQGPAGVTRYYYRTSTSALDVATITDPYFSGASLGVLIPQGLYYFHVLGTNDFNVQFGTASYGAVHIDTGAPLITSLTAQTSATDSNVIPNGGPTLSPIPHFMWTGASVVPQDPIQGYSYVISAGSSATPATFVTTTLGFWDAAPALTVSGVYYFNVRPLNLAGTWGAPVSMNFNFTTVPSANNIILKSNYFNPMAGTCMHLIVQTALPGHVKAELFTLLGRRVVTLADADVNASVQDYPWCGRNSSNEIVASGAYLLHVETPNEKKNYKVGVVK